MLPVHRPHFDEHRAKMNFVTNLKNFFPGMKSNLGQVLAKIEIEEIAFIAPLAILFTTLLHSNLHSEVCLSRPLRPQPHAAAVGLRSPYAHPQPPLL